MFTSTDDAIKFSYKIDELLEKVFALSTYAAKVMPLSKEEDADSNVDKYAVTVDEEEFVKPFLKEASMLVFERMVKITGRIADAYRFDTDSGEIHLELQKEGTFNPNRLPIIDHAAEEYMVAYTLVRWAEVNKLADEIQIRSIVVADMERKLIANLFDLCKPTFCATYTNTSISHGR